MGVKLLDSLEMQTGLPLDNRDIVNNIDERNNIEPAVRYIGMEVYVIEENKKYRLEEGIENFNWQEMKSKAVASELITDDEHMTVSKTEKDTWNSKAEGNHNHDGVYQPVGNYSLDTHNHDNSYSKLNHAHTSSEIGTYTKEEIDNKSIQTSTGLLGGNTLGNNIVLSVDMPTNEEVEAELNSNFIKEIFELATEQDIRNLFVGTTLEGGTTYNLSELTTDESKVVNMRLLSLFNDLVLSRLSNQTTDIINKFKSETNITAGKGLLGGGSLSNNISFDLDYPTNSEVETNLKGV